MYREPHRRLLQPNFSETIDRRRNLFNSSSINISHQTNIRDLENQNPQLIRETEEENLNEISFGTRKDIEIENDNLFADSDTISQG